MAAEVPKSIRASLYIDGKPAEASLANVKAVTKTLNRELEKLTIGTEAWNRKMREVQAHERTLANVQREVRGVGGAFGWLRTEIGKLGALAVGFLGFQFITSQFQNTISANAKLSDSLSDIRRVAGLTEREVLNLNKSLSALDTRTSTGGLREIAIIGGKLGVSKTNLLGFTEAVDKLVVTLGDELGNADQITTNLGKILNVFDGKVDGDNITKLGNAFVVLANAGVASGGFLADFAQRVSGVAKAAHLSLGSTLGLAAGLEELGGKVDSSSTAVQRLLGDIAADLPKAASIAKMHLADFQKLFDSTPEKALLAYAEGLVKNKTAFSEVASSFKDAGEEGQRVISTLAALGGNAKFMQEKMDLGNKSLQDTAAISEGFALKNENFAASVDKLGKSFTKLTAGTGISSFFQNIILGTSALIEGITNNAKAIGSLIKMVVIAGVAWGTYKVYLAAANSQTLAFIVNMVTGNQVMALSRVSTIALSGVQALLAGNFAKAAQAARLLSAALISNPIGAVVAAVAAAVTAVVLFKETTNDAAEAQKLLNNVQKEAASKIQEQKQGIEDLTKIIYDENEAYSDRIRAIKILRELLPDHLKAYTDEQILSKGAKVAVDEYVKSLQHKAEVEAAQEKMKALKKERLDIDQGEGDLNFGQNVGLVLTDIFSGRDNGERFRKQRQKDNKLDAQRRNQLQQDALNEKFANDFKDQTLKKVDDTGGSTATDPVTETVQMRRKKIEEQISVLKNAYDQLAATDKAGMAKNLAQREALQKQLDALDGKKNGGTDKKVDDARKQSKALSQLVKEFNAQQAADLLAKNKKEIAESENKYQHLIDKEKTFLTNNKKNKYLSDAERQIHQAEIDQLEADKKKSVNAILLRQEKELVDKIKELRTSLGQVYETELQKEKDRINAAYDQMLKDGYDAGAVELNRKRDLTNAEIREEQRLQDKIDELKAEGAVTEAQKEKVRVARINKKYDDELAALKKSFSDKLLATEKFQEAVTQLEANRKNEIRQREKVSEEEKGKAIKEAAITAAQDIANGVFEIGRANRQAETDAELSKLNKQRDNELANKNLTEAQRTAITDKYANLEREIKLKAWKADQAASLKQAEINGFLAVTKAMTSAPWPLNLISAAGAAVAAGVEIAKISSMKPPEFADGGMSDADPAGYVGQATLFKNSASGRPFVAGEAGREWIAPNWMLKNPRTANIIGMLETARKEKRAFAGGGYSANNAAAAMAAPVDLTPLLEEQQLTRKALSEMQLVFSFQNFEREHQKFLKSKNDAKG